jgi:MoaA/NifB/PqqE/SkfB family radical SAM enzyme
LRRDLEALVRAVSDAVRIRYITLLTHGGMLTPERARGLWDAGVDQFNISLDYLDGRHDDARKIPGLTAKIFRLVPGMRERGVDNIRFNTVIKDDNLDQLIPIVEHARELGCGVNFSTYTDFKNGNKAHLLRAEQLRELESVIAELISYKRRHRGVITSSDYYLKQIPRYVRGEMTEPCQAGIRTIHVNPFGHVRRCPDLQSDFHWSEFRKYEKVACNACYYACRGEAQAPLTLSRVRDLIA